MTADRNDMAYWLPLVQRAGLTGPATRLLTVAHDLSWYLDGPNAEYEPELFGLIADIQQAGDHFGWPCFLRTGHTSGKHHWRDTCYLPHRGVIAEHLVALVEYSNVVDFMGLPCTTFAVRQLIPTAPLFRCCGFRDLPIAREFRFFVRDGIIEHRQFYWPTRAIADGSPDNRHWRADLKRARRFTDEDAPVLCLVERAARALPGYWSVDVMQAADGAWWLIDCAEGDRSFRYDDGAE